jgi:hypothetical protein
MLLSVLVHSVPVHVRLATKDSLVILGKSRRSSAHMVGAAHLGVYQSAPQQWALRAKGNVKWY